MSVIYYPAAPALARHAKAGRSVLRQTLSFITPSFSPSRCHGLSLCSCLALCLISSSALPSVCVFFFFFFLCHSLLSLFLPHTVYTHKGTHTHTLAVDSPDTSLSGDIQTTLVPACAQMRMCAPPARRLSSSPRFSVS